jgi:hypothetical protein
MYISENTLSNLIQAVKKTGEEEVNALLKTIVERDLKVIDEISTLCCNKMGINKSFLQIKNNRVKTDCVAIIVYILKNNNIRPSDIISYFPNYTIRINDTYNYISNLSENIPSEKRLKQVIKEIQTDSIAIFEKYYIKNNHHETC